jgi:hypothetical protein
MEDDMTKAKSDEVQTDPNPAANGQAVQTDPNPAANGQAVQTDPIPDETDPTVTDPVLDGAANDPVYRQNLADEAVQIRALVDDFSTLRYLPEPEMKAALEAKFDLFGGSMELSDDRWSMSQMRIEASGYNLANMLDNWCNAARRALLEMGQ